MFTLREARWLKPPTLARHHSIHLHEVLVRNMELMRHHPPEEFRKGHKETPHSDHLPESFSLASTRKDSGSEWLAKDNPETNPVTIRPKTESHMAELFSWVPLPYCSPLGCPFWIKCLALSAHVSPRTIHFWVLDKSPVLGPGRGPPSCNIHAGRNVVNMRWKYKLIGIQEGFVRSSDLCGKISN